MGFVICWVDACALMIVVNLFVLGVWLVGWFKCTFVRMCLFIVGGNLIGVYG